MTIVRRWTIEDLEDFRNEICQALDQIRTELESIDFLINKKYKKTL